MIFGLVLFMLGAGNWTYAAVKAAQFKARQIEAIRQGGFDVSRPFRGTASILEERTEMHEFYEDSVSRYRYYKTVRRGGRFLMSIGGVIVLAALVRRIAVPQPGAAP